MKILRIKLVNFIGIMHGMNTDEVEIDFTKGKNRIIMFRGKNGSGKSTIVGALTPFKQNTDNREQLILEGKDGRKEIDYEHNGHIYKIVHTYPEKGTAQSFIAKDGVELNENGGVKTCEEIILKEFGITKDYFKIGKIGSNTKNFVDFTTADRKKYIGTFLDINDMLSAYKTVNEKLKLLKKDVISIANELKSYEPKEVVETRISSLDLEIKKIDGDLSQYYAEQGKYQEKINSLEKLASSYDLQALLQRQKEKQQDILINREIKEKLMPMLDTSNVSENREKVQLEISNLQGDIRVNDTKKIAKSSLMTDYKNKITAIEMELKGLGNPEDIDKFSKLIAEEDEKINSISEEITKNPLSGFVENMLKNGIDISRYLNKFSDFTSFMEKYFKNLGEKSINASQTCLELFLQDQSEDSFQRQLKASRDAISAKNELLLSQEKERTSCESHLSQVTALEKRPARCTIDECPFIAEALKWRNIKDIIIAKDNEIQQSKKDLDYLNIKAERLSEIFSLFRNFNLAYTNVSARDNPILAEFCKEKSLVDWINGPLNEFQSSRECFIKNIRNAIDDIDRIRTIIAEKAANEKSKKAYENSDSTVREKYNKDRKENEEKLAEVTKDYSDLETVGSELSIKLAAAQKLFGEYSDYIMASSKLDSATTMLTTVNADIDKATKVVNELNEAKESLALVNNKISNAITGKNTKSTEYNNNIAVLSQINNLNKKLGNLKVIYKPTDTVAKALSPTSGIPLVLIQMYLGETEKITNELLNLAYNGDFRIKFVTTEKEFSIQVATKDEENVKADISLASQGEIALTTISISLALIEQSIGEYNILCLDEIDGPLDSDNRENFIDILNSQITKLGIEQVFVISHNNAFDTCPLDLVLLKNSDVDKDNESYMENKTIIFDYNE